MHPLRIRWRRLKADVRNVLRYADVRSAGNGIVRATDFRSCARPVLLLPGFLSTRRSLSVLEMRLRRDGYCVFSINLGGLFNTFNTRSIEESALRVQEKVERLYRRHELGPLTIIGHSKGGLIGRYYVKRLGGADRACTLITLGTPHRGTPSAYWGAALCGAFAPSIWQLMPMSPFIRRLKQGVFPSRVHFASIYSPGDGVVPVPMATLDVGSHANLVNLEVPDVSHHEFLVRKRVYELVREQIERGYVRSLARRVEGAASVEEGPEIERERALTGA